MWPTSAPFTLWPTDAPQPTPITNFPTSTYYPSFTPAPSPSIQPSTNIPTPSYGEVFNPTKQPITPTTATFIEKFKLTISHRLLPGTTKYEVIVNGTSPGPPIRVTLGNKVEVTVVNEISDDLTTVHWHGMAQRGTPFSDGIINITQCPITNVVGYNATIQWFTHSHPRLQALFGITVTIENNIWMAYTEHLSSRV
jgi:FtsP/CotA-like multicopper oxidase with cupredoxin domain